MKDGACNIHTVNVYYYLQRWKGIGIQFARPLILMIWDPDLSNLWWNPLICRHYHLKYVVI